MEKNNDSGVVLARGGAIKHLRSYFVRRVAAFRTPHTLRHVAASAIEFGNFIGPSSTR
jgi:hypothetical protein